MVCNRQLGKNESIEHFPIGQRLAFDPDKGRLWVICPHCFRWNLTPLEERWEAIEDAERLFRAARLRMSTENIGLARLRDGTDLVRIGKPQRPELAAWRYGVQFSERRKRVMIAGAAAAGVFGAGAAVLPTALIAPLLLPLAVASVAIIGLGNLTGNNAIFTPRFVQDDAGSYLLVPQDALSWTRIVGDAERWGLRVPFVDERPDRVRRALDFINHGARGERVLHGDRALEAARALLPLVNGTGANARAIEGAVSLVSEWGDASHGFAWAASRAHEWSLHTQFGDPGSLSFLPREVRLALEMSAFEEYERRALAGELADLERAWRQAEEVAAIADDLLTPSPVLRALNRLRGTTPPSPTSRDSSADRR